MVPCQLGAQRGSKIVQSRGSPSHVLGAIGEMVSQRSPKPLAKVRFLHRPLQVFMSVLQRDAGGGAV